MEEIILKKQVSILLLASLVLAGCSKEVEHKEESAAPVESAIPVEITKSLEILPSFVNGHPDIVALAYKTAAKNQELLTYIPCYCGCGDSIQHKDNLDCFIKEIKENGEVVWDEHGVNCDVCIETAIESAQQHQDKVPASEIRKYIDEKYKEGYSEPTKTEMPPASL